MIKYRLRANAVSPDSETPLIDYIRSCGVEDTDRFMCPTKEDELDPWRLKNMKECVIRLHNAFEAKLKFFLIVDSDADGYTSASIFYNYFKSIYPNVCIEWMQHEGKEHGIIVDKIPIETDIIIVPDAGSMQIEEQDELLDRGKTIIIIDHHNITIENAHPNLVLVNNQCSPDFPNKALSGAGMVLKTIQAYDEYYDAHGNPDHYYDLATVGILSDCMDMRPLDNNYIAHQGLRNIQSAILLALMKQQERGFADLKHPTKTEIVWQVSPLINGVVREGTAEEKELLFRAFIHEPTQETIVSDNRGATRVETYYQYVARLAANIKGRQDRKKLKCFEFLCKKIEAQGLDKNKIIAVVASADDEVPTPQTLTGVIAMELAKHYNKPCLVLRPKREGDKTIYAGSGRAEMVDGLPSFLEYVREDDASVYGEGHHFAFGAALDATKYQEFLERSNVVLADADIGNPLTQVEYIYNGNDTCASNFILRMAYGKDLYGNGVPAPQFALDFVIAAQDLSIIGSKNDTLKWRNDGFECIKFKAKSIIDNLPDAPYYHIIAIGEPSINSWMGRQTPQLILNNIEITPAENYSKVDEVRKLF